MSIANTDCRKIERATLLYFFVSLGIYVLLCLFLGRANWIYSVFFENLFGDLGGDTPITYVNAIVNNVHTINAVDEANISLIETLPAAIQFTIMDGFIHRYIKKENFPTKALNFISGYFLISILAMAWSEPVTLERFVNSSFFIIMFVVWILCSLAYAIRNSLQRTLNVHRVGSITVGAVMSILYKMIEEYVKVWAVSVLLAIPLVVIREVTDMINASLTQVTLSISALIIFMLLNRYISPLIERFSIWIVRMLRRNVEDGLSSIEAETEFACIFQLVASLIALVGCVLLH